MATLSYTVDLASPDDDDESERRTLRSMRPRLATDALRSSLRLSSAAAAALTPAARSARAWWWGFARAGFRWPVEYERARAAGARAEAPRAARVIEVRIACLA